jgi:hypothetical protein
MNSIWYQHRSAPPAINSCISSSDVELFRAEAIVGSDRPGLLQAIIFSRAAPAGWTFAQIARLTRTVGANTRVTMLCSYPAQPGAPQIDKIQRHYCRNTQIR